MLLSLPVVLWGGDNNDLPNTEDFIDLFVSATIAPKQWVYSIEDFEKRIQERTIHRLEYVIARELNENIKNYSRDEVVKKWDSEIKVVNTKDSVVNDQVQKFINEVKSIKNLKIQTAEVPNANVILNIYGGDPEIHGLKYYVGYPRYDVLFEGWKYRFYWPEKIHVAEKIALYDTVMEDIKALFKADFNYYRDTTSFSPQNSNHIEGYIYTNSNHGIKKSECYIYAGHVEVIKRILVKQCLMRSLGFVGFVNKEIDTALSLEIDEQKSYGENLTALDKYLISILYSRKINAGINKNELIKVLPEIDNDMDKSPGKQYG